MNDIKISIIVPVYNVEKYLRECLDSVINQTLKDIEIICINDGSTDNSLSILEEYAHKDSRVVIINKENGGYASAINTGLDSAQGEFIQIVESDDYCELDMCEAMYNKIKDSDADFVTADFYFTLGNKIKKTHYLKQEDSSVNSFTLKSLPYIIAKQAYPWKSLYRTSFLKEKNIRMFEDEYGSYQDQPWNALTLALADKILYINKPLYYYRLDASGSSTNNGSRKMINYIKRKSQTKEILEKYGLYNGLIKEYYCDSAVGGCLFFFKRISFDYKEEYYNEMKNFLKQTIDESITFKFFTKKNRKRYDNIVNKSYKEFYRLEILKHKLLKGWKV